jgi:hypothetical protein
MKSYLLNLAPSTWRELTLYQESINVHRKKLKQTHIHRSTLIRLAIIKICSLTPAELDDLLISDTDSNDRETN